MKPLQIALYSIAILGGCFLIAQLSQPAVQMANKGKEISLENAVWSAEATLSSLGESGYIQWTPSTSVEETMMSLNAAQIPMPEDYEEYDRSLPDPVEYVLHQPNAPWQVVLVPLDDQNLVRIEAYGEDLSVPLIQKEFPCC
ncbi:MAG: hypothetical protein AAF215_05515 [Cyanobacteria bacterium P01_A01_bin.123]